MNSSKVPGPGCRTCQLSRYFVWDLVQDTSWDGNILATSTPKPTLAVSQSRTESSNERIVQRTNGLLATDLHERLAVECRTASCPKHHRFASNPPSAQAPNRNQILGALGPARSSTETNHVAPGPSSPVPRSLNLGSSIERGSALQATEMMDRSELLLSKNMGPNDERSAGAR